MEDTTSIKDILRYITSKWYLVLAILVATVAAGEIYLHYFQTPMYQSSTQVVLLNDNSTTITTNDVVLSNNLVNTYAEIVKSRNVLSQVVKNQNLDLTTDQLADKITVSTITSTQLINVEVTDTSPEQAQKIANEIAKVFKAEIAKIYNLDNVQIVDKAALPSEPYNINLMKQTLIYLAVGLAAGVCVAMLLYLLDTTIKDTEVVENDLGLTVLGIIPKTARRQEK